MFDTGSLSSAAAAAAEAARRAAAEAARRAAEAAARAAAEAARKAAAEAARKAAAEAAQDMNKANTGQLRLSQGVQQAQEMADPPFEPTPAAEDLTLGGGRTRVASAGDGDLSIGAGETGPSAAEDLTVAVEEEASTTEMSAGEAAREERLERYSETGNDAQLIRETSNRNRALNTALEAMPPEQREQFNVVREHAQKAEELGVQSAVHELEQMAINRELTPELTKQLHRIATQETASNLLAKDPNAATRVLGETIRQVSDATSIQQDPKYETCGLNALEQEFATQNPEGYAKFIADMVSQDFRATLPGDPLSNPPQPWEGVPLNTHQIEMPLSSDRSLTSTMFQQSLRAAYASNGEMANDPITAEQFTQIMNHMNPNSERVLVGISPEQRDAAMSEMRPGTIVVLNNYDPSGTAQANSHAATVTGIEDGMVTLNDPYGKSYTLPIEDFQAELRGMVVDKSSGQVETDAEGNSTIGGGRIRISAAGTGDLSMGGGRTRFAAVAAGEL